MGTLQSCGSLSLTFEWVQSHGVSWIVPHSLWHFCALKSSSGGKRKGPPPLSLAPPPPTRSCLQLSLSRGHCDRWSCCWALAAASGASLHINGIRVQTCHCLHGLSNRGSSWEFSWEVSPSLHRLILSHAPVANGLMYDTSNEAELSFNNWANVFLGLLPVVLYVQRYFPP